MLRFLLLLGRNMHKSVLISSQFARSAAEMVVVYKLCCGDIKDAGCFYFSDVIISIPRACVRTMCRLVAELREGFIC